MLVYSDGSGLEGEVSAAMVLYRDGVEGWSLREHLGRDSNAHMVFEAKLVSMMLAAELVRAERQVRTVTIGVE